MDRNGPGIIAIELVKSFAVTIEAGRQASKHTAEPKRAPRKPHSARLASVRQAHVDSPPIAHQAVDALLASGTPRDGLQEGSHIPFLAWGHKSGHIASCSCKRGDASGCRSTAGRDLWELLAEIGKQLIARLRRTFPKFARNDDRVSFLFDSKCTVVSV